MKHQQSQILIQNRDGQISVLDTEVAVIEINDSSRVCSQVVMGVNCLRSGCPAVQFIMDAGESIVVREAVSRELNANVASSFLALTLTDGKGVKKEHFEINFPNDKSLKEGLYVIKVTRSVVT